MITKNDIMNKIIDNGKVKKIEIATRTIDYCEKHVNDQILFCAKKACDLKNFNVHGDVFKYSSDTFGKDNNLIELTDCTNGYFNRTNISLPILKEYLKSHGFEVTIDDYGYNTYKLKFSLKND